MPTPDILGALASRSRSVLVQEAALLTLDPTMAEGTHQSGDRGYIDLSRAADRDPDAVV